MRTKLIAAIAALSVCAGGFSAMHTCSIAAEDDIKIIYDGEELTLDTAPVIIDDSTMVPIRAIFEAFGASVKWDSDTSTVTAKKKSKTISMTVGSNEVTKNDETITVQIAPQIVDDRTMVSIRTVSELLGLDVEWDEESRTVIITTPTEESDESWKENTGTIDLDDLSVSGDGISVDGNVITITAGGDFTVSGENDDAQIIVKAYDEDGSKAKVKLRLDSMSLTNPNGAAIYVEAADKFYITLESGTENTISDGEEYSDESINACIYSRADMEIKGSGALTVNAQYNHAIVCNDSMEIANGDIEINSKNDGIHVKETLLICGGELNITSEGDGISADEIVNITDGEINIETTGDVASSTDMGFGGGMGGGMNGGGRGMNGGGMGGGMNGNTDSQTQTEASQTAVTLSLSTNTVSASSENTSSSGEVLAGEDSSSSEDASSKGIKSGWMTNISGGEITLSTTDHAIHSSGEINLTGGIMEIASSAGKGISAHEDINIDGSDINITEATEGIESKQIMTIDSGNINIVCSDDGLNAGGNNSADGMGGGMNGGMGSRDMNRDTAFDTAEGDSSQADSSVTDSQMPGGRDMGMPGGMDMNSENAQMSDAGDTSGENAQNAMPGGRGMGMPGGMDMNGENAQMPETDDASSENSQNAMPEGRGMKGGMGGRDMNGNMPNGGANTQPSENDTESSSGSQALDGETQRGNTDGGNAPSGGNRGGFGSGGNDTISTEHHIQINGGTLTINAKGDGIDSNGSIVIDGGYIVVNGPSGSGNGSIDYETMCQINGGTLIAAGASGMIETPSSSSQQYVLSVYTDSQHNAGELITIKDSSGNIVLSMAPLKSYGHVFFSSDVLEEGETYTVYEGGECTGEINTATGVYTGGSVSGENETKSVQLSDSTVVTVR